jgi:hypothetical protein
MIFGRFCFRDTRGEFSADEVSAAIEIMCSWGFRDYENVGIITAGDGFTIQISFGLGEWGM